MRKRDQLDIDLGNARSINEVLEVLTNNNRFRNAIQKSITQAVEAEQFRIDNPNVMGSSGDDRSLPEGETQAAVFGIALHDALIENLPDAIKWVG